MDKRETTKLFRFLGQIYPNAQEFSQETAMLAWQLVLEPYAYEDVKNAVLDWARYGEKRTFPPRVSELTEKLMPQTPPKKFVSAAARPLSVGERWQQYIEENGLDAKWEK